MARLLKPGPKPRPKTPSTAWPAPISATVSRRRFENAAKLGRKTCCIKGVRHGSQQKGQVAEVSEFQRYERGDKIDRAV
jgi:hypothetical protein